MDKPLWVREHSCPACGFTADRDHNAALNVLSSGLGELGITAEIGVVHSEVTPAETGADVSTDDCRGVDASTVVETGSRGLKEARQRE